MSASITLSRESLVDLVEQLNALVESIRKVSGTASQRKNAATLEALGHELGDNERDDIVRWLSEAPLTSVGDLAKMTAELDKMAEQVADEHVTALLKSQSGASDEQVTAVREAFKAKREQAQAMHDILAGPAGVAMGIDVSDVNIPTLRGSSSSSSTGARKASASKFLRFYHEDPTGKRSELSDGQQKFSSVAWYYGPRMLGNGGKPGSVKTEDVRAFLTAQGVSVDPATHAWSVSTPNGTFGADEVPQAEQADADNTEEVEAA